MPFTPEQIQTFVTFAKEVGFPFLAGVFAIIIIYMMAHSYFKRVDSETDMGKSSHAELIELRKHERGIVDDRLELERKYTECREALVKAQGYIALIENQNQTAVEEFLDNTEDFDRTLDSKDKEILLLSGQLADKDAIIAAKDAVIAEQNKTIANLVSGKPPQE